VVNQYMRRKVPGFVRNVHFKNVTVEGAPGQYRIVLVGADVEHNVQQVTFENVSVLGARLTLDSPNMNCGGHVQDVRFGSSP
jgi:hypothetical protein